MAQRVSQVVVSALYGGTTINCRVTQTVFTPFYSTSYITRQRVSQTVFTPFYSTSYITRQVVSQTVMQVLWKYRTNFNSSYGYIEP